MNVYPQITIYQGESDGNLQNFFASQFTADRFGTSLQFLEHDPCWVQCVYSSTLPVSGFIVQKFV